MLLNRGNTGLRQAWSKPAHALHNLDCPNVLTDGPLWTSQFRSTYINLSNISHHVKRKELHQGCRIVHDETSVLVLVVNCLSSSEHPCACNICSVHFLQKCNNCPLAKIWGPREILTLPSKLEILNMQHLITLSAEPYLPWTMKIPEYSSSQWKLPPHNTKVLTLYL
jgi:hypothetical protein